MKRYPALPYILPFAVFILFIAFGKYVAVPQYLRLLVVAAVVLLVAREPLREPPRHILTSILVGIGVFFVWVGPELLFPGYHRFWLFSNSVMGHPATSVNDAQQTSGMFLVFRVLVSFMAVPVLEELFWRGWMMRWLIDRDFTRVPLGAYHPQAFWLVALLFASEHGSFWDVGLAAGVIYNWWMVRTRNLWDCILAHAVTNLVLAGYVVFFNQWQYWI